MDIRKELASTLKKLDVSSLSDEQVKAIGKILSKRKSKSSPNRIAHPDIAENRKAQDALIKSEEKYKQIFENIQTIYYEVNLEGKVLEVSPSIEYFSKYKRKDVIGLDINTIYVDTDDRKKFLEEISKGGTVRNYRLDIRDKDNSIIHTSVNAKLVKDPKGNPQKIIGAMLNISDQVVTFDALKKSEERFREIYENTNDIIYTMDFNGNFTSVNPCAERILGYKFDEIDHVNMIHYISPETAQVAFDNIKRKIAGEKTNTVYEVDFVNKDGSYTSLEINSMLQYKDGKPIGIFGIARNVSERKEAKKALKKSEEKYKTIFENAPLGIMTADVKGNIIEINPTLLQMLGSSSIEETKKINVLEFKPLVDAGSVKAFRQCIETGNPVIYETTYTSVWGKIINARLYTKPLKNSKGKITSFQVIIEDITEEKESENQLKSALVEKEILLREVHHRVKNNMQIIISLINMQMQDIEDEAMIKKYKDLQQRVRAMSIIHEDLYMSEDLSKINFGRYLNKLSNNLLHSYSQESEIEMKFNLADIFLSIDTAIPLGLIVNELLSNSLKYAFPEEWIKSNKNVRQEIHIEFIPTGEEHILKIRDNGTGMPVDYNQEQSKTLGLMLVDILVNQLKGSLKINKKNGLSYEIEIRKE